METALIIIMVCVFVIPVWACIFSGEDEKEDKKDEQNSF